MQRKWLIFSGAVILQLLLLAVVLAPRLNILSQGKTVVLETLPYDPYNIFSGYYVDLRYRISEPENLPGQKTFKERQQYYIVLKPNDRGIWQPVRVSEGLPRLLNANEAVIRGRYRYSRLNYSIEQYYLPEAQRQRIGAILRDAAKTALVEIKVKDTGEAALIKIKVGRESFEY